MTAYEAPQSKSATGEIAFQDTPNDKWQYIVTYVNKLKDMYFDSPEYQNWLTRISKVQNLVNQNNPDQTTRYGLVQSILRTRHDNLIDTFSDLFDHPDLIMFEADDKKDVQFADTMQAYANRMLRRIGYHKHLSKRFAYIPEYGWSISADGYVYNEGMKLTANGVPSYIPGLEEITFTREMDTALDRPDPMIIPTEHWFGRMQEWGDGQPYQGYLRRWSLKDVSRAYDMETENGKPLYNRDELKKLMKQMYAGNVDRDMRFKVLDTQGNIVNDVKWDSDKAGAYVDVIIFYGPLNGCNDKDLSKDASEYDIVCTRNSLLKWCENPQYGYNPITHARSHPKISSPLSRTFLDLIYPHQQFTDFMVNSAMESITDTMTRLIAYWPEDMADTQELFNPAGYNAFLEMTSKEGKLPQFIQPNSMPGFGAMNQVLEIIDRDKQRAGATDQDLGVSGKVQDKTATAARILASASSKSTRAVVKNLSRDGIVPQIKNLIMLDLMHGDPQHRMFNNKDKSMSVDAQVVNWWLRDSSAKMNDDITEDKDSKELKFQNFLNIAVGVLPQLRDPAHMIEALRMGGHMAGLTNAQIDTIVPPPIPPEISQQQQAAQPQQEEKQPESQIRVSVSLDKDGLNDPRTPASLERLGVTGLHPDAGGPAVVPGTPVNQAPAPQPTPQGGLHNAMAQVTPR